MLLRCESFQAAMSLEGLGCAKTKSYLVVMPSGRQIFCVFFAPRMTIGPKIPGAVIPRRVFTQPGSFAPFLTPIHEGLAGPHLTP